MNRSITLRKVDIDRFWSKVNKRGENDCWTWKAAQTYGYGEQKVQKVHFIASRLSWMIHFGEIPDGLHVLHSCDNPPCVNPKHLFLGTDADNTKDKVSKGRAKGGSMPGEKNPSAKLREEDVLQIKRLLPHKTISAIARMYKVARPTINRIKKGITWLFLNDENF